MTKLVTIVDRGTGPSYQGITLETVRVEWTCPKCGKPRGPVRYRTFCEDGEYYSVSVWENECGHVDKYEDVLKEYYGKNI